MLDTAGEQARVVGGAVRNTLLGEAHGDIDIATTALPDEVMRRVQAAGFKAVPTGIEHGTVTVVAAGRPFEVTTLREDVETFGRHAKVVFGRNWRRDAERRDFTINALSVSRDRTVYDYVGGLADIETRRVRFIGNAAARIAEDYLRILRFFRFHASYGAGAPDAQGLAACIAGRAGLEQLSRERIRMEVAKLLLARHAVPALAVMTETGLLEQVLGGVPLLASYANMTKLEAMLALPSDAARRLGALSVRVSRTSSACAIACGSPMRSMNGWRRWRMAGGMFPGELGEREARVLLYRLGNERFTDRVLLAWTRSPKARRTSAGAGSRACRRAGARRLFRSGRLISWRGGVPKGPRLGVALAAAEEAWIKAGFPTDPAALAATADAAVAAAKVA